MTRACLNGFLSGCDGARLPEEFQCRREDRNQFEPFAVAVMRGGTGRRLFNRLVRFFYYLRAHNCGQLLTWVEKAARRPKIPVQIQFDAGVSLESEAAGSMVTLVQGRQIFECFIFVSKIFIRNIRNFTPYENFPLYSMNVIVVVKVKVRTNRLTVMASNLGEKTLVVLLILIPCWIYFFLQI